jgi:hypothetical protein
MHIKDTSMSQNLFLMGMSLLIHKPAILILYWQNKKSINNKKGQTISKLKKLQSFSNSLNLIINFRNLKINKQMISTCQWMHQESHPRIMSKITI